jgi:hypothetical protein
VLSVKIGNKPPAATHIVLKSKNTMTHLGLGRVWSARCLVSGIFIADGGEGLSCYAHWKCCYRFGAIDQPWIECPPVHRYKDGELKICCVAFLHV